MHDELRDRKMQAAASADMALVLRALHIPIKPCGTGYVLEEHPQLYLQGPLWRHTADQPGPKGLFTHGNILHFLVEYCSMRPGQALDTVCSIAAPALMECGIQRMLPKERLQQDRRVKRFKLLAGADSRAACEVQDTRVPEEMPEMAERARNSLVARGIAREVTEDIFTSQAAYAARRSIIFPGYTEEAKRCWYYVLSFRRPEDEGHIGSHAGAFSAWPWIWGRRSSERLHIYATPLEALAFLTLARCRKPLEVLKQDAHMALTEMQGACGVFGHLSRSPFVREIILHLSENVSQVITAQLKYDAVTILSEPPAASCRSWLQMLKERRNDS